MKHLIKYKEKLYKILSRNDTGETHSHQSGISIPKKAAASSVFPKLSKDILNPRVDLNFYDEDNNMYQCQYIYYNDKYFGKPANKCHDEFRLTCVKDFLRRTTAKAGDEIWFGIDVNGVRRIGISDKSSKIDNPNIRKENGFTVIKLSSSWRSIKY